MTEPFEYVLIENSKVSEDLRINIEALPTLDSVREEYGEIGVSDDRLSSLQNWNFFLGVLSVTVLVFVYATWQLIHR